MTVRTRKPYALSAMQVRFRDNYLAYPLGERDIKQAALDAGYSPKTAYTQGRKLLQNQLIRKSIMAESPTRAIEMATIDSAWMLKELADLWETPLNTLFNEDGTLKPIVEMSREAQRLIGGFEVREEVDLNEHGRQIGATRIRVGKIRIIDRLRVLEDIGKHTRVNAFGTREQADVNKSFADLLRAASKSLTTSTLQELDITPVKEED